MKRLNCRRQVAMILLVPLWLGGCNVGGSGGRSDGEQKPDSGGVSADSAAAGSSEVMNLDDLEAGMELLRRAEQQHVATCMSERGFPQFAESQTYDTGAEAEASLGTLRIDLLEFGPYTEAQAQKYGVIGTSSAFEKSAPAVILGDNAAFTQNSEECRSSMTTTGNDEVEDLIASLIDFNNRVATEFGALVDPELESALRDRLECLAKTYPSVDIDTVMAAGSTEEVLAAFDIAAGSWSDTEQPEPVVPPGEIVVVPPPPPPVYSPSAAEVSLALAYVQCGYDVDFEARVREAEQRARDQVLTSHESELIAFTEQYRQAEASLVETARVETVEAGASEGAASAS